MPTINAENEKSIRDPMTVHVVVGPTDAPYFEFTNDDLISVELNLRSDLSPIDPSLPESEISILAYSPSDTSEIVINIPDGTPLYYEAGYAGDMSPMRKFYISEPITWADNMLTIKAVDAVYMLDSNFPAAYIGASDVLGSPNYTVVMQYGSDAWTTEKLCSLFYLAITGAGVTLESMDEQSPLIAGTYMNSKRASCFIESTSRRDLIANLMNLCRLDLGSGFSADTSDQTLYLTYVDAGIPTFNRKKPAPKWSIYETDCGDIKKNVARSINKIIAPNKLLQCPAYYRSKIFNRDESIKAGNINIQDDTGGAISFDEYTALCDALAYSENTSTGEYMRVVGLNSVANNVKGLFAYGSSSDHNIGLYCFKDSSYMPWDSDMSTFWAEAISLGVIEADAEDASFDTYGAKAILIDNEQEFTKTGDGITETPSKTCWYGLMYSTGSVDGNTYKLLPDMGFAQLMERSGITGSFTWKGDPRMQPRDVFTFIYKDGTEELRTIETINLKHEGGGTVAEITYRKGIV